MIRELKACPDRQATEIVGCPSPIVDRRSSMRTAASSTRRQRPRTSGRGAGIACATGHDSAVAIRENLPDEPFGIRIPLSVPWSPGGMGFGGRGAVANASARAARGRTHLGHSREGETL
jgi:hypothetical protein